MNTRSGSSSILNLAAALSIVAGLIHVLVTPEHFTEWWGYGLFFLATVITQLLYAPAVVRWPRQFMLLAGITGNAAIAAMWVISRSIGVPFFGPGAGEIEPVGLLDVVSTATEIALIAILVFAVWSSTRQANLSTPYEQAGAAESVSVAS